MKSIILTIMAVVLAVPAFGQGALKERTENQKGRIKAGVKDGSLTKPEAARLRQDQREIKRNIRQQTRDGGKLTAREKARITAGQNKASRDIYRQRRDRQNQK